MIAEVTPLVPAAFAAFGDRLAVETGGVRAQLAARLRDRAAFDGVMDRFGEPYGTIDRRALVSLWTQSYLAALIIPSVTALLCLDRVLPVALEEIGLELDGQGGISRFLLVDAGRCRREGDPGSRFATLVGGHLQPFVELCSAHSGLSRRVLWSNAGLMMEIVMRELIGGASVVPAVRAEAEALLGWRDHPDSPRSPLSHTLRSVETGGERRRVCCLRYRLPGVASCGSLCPANRPLNRSC